ncbi:Uncharacterised protein [Mycobacterium tuberculosis]|nr:Uncharacterised protein [Mycobacterium tuberculosis]
MRSVMAPMIEALTPVSARPMKSVTHGDSPVFTVR